MNAQTITCYDPEKSIRGINNFRFIPIRIKTVWVCTHCQTIVKQAEQKNGCPRCGFLKFAKKII